MTAIDDTGTHAIETFAKRLSQSGRSLILCGAMQQPSRLLQSPRFLDRVGRENIMPNVQAALDRASVVYQAGLKTLAS
jgi:SulP family sulfate permease